MIKVSNLTKFYFIKGKKIPILNNINFTINNYETTVILGLNGSGKSTLIRILGGVENYQQGEIKITEKVSWPCALKSGFQSKLTARENIVFICRVYLGNDKELINKKIKFIKNFSETGKYFDYPISTFSQGMKSRVAFGLAMSFDFDIYLSDESLAVGDLRFKAKCESLIRKKIKNKSSFILTDHAYKKKIDFVKKVLIVHNKKVLQYDDPDKGYNEYKQILEKGSI